MATPQALHHSLLRPCVLHILRAAGYHTTRPSVLDTLTDLAARYMFLLAQESVRHSVNNGSDLEPTVEDVRMALQDCGAIGTEQDEADYYGIKEDTQGMEEFQAWITGKVNKEIQRIALEGDGKEDYLTALKKKNSTADEDSRYIGTLLGKAAEPRPIKVEGGDLTSVKDWAARLRTTSKRPSMTPATSRPASSGLSSLGDQSLEDMEF